MGPEYEAMHIDRANEVAVAPKATAVARPGSASGLVRMPAAGTPAAGSSFGAGEARDAGERRFMGQVVDVPTVFPQGHALVVTAASACPSDAVRIADEERSHLLFDAKGNHLPGGLMPEIADTAFAAAAQPAPGPLQLPPATRALLAATLLFGQPAQLLAALSFEGTDAASRDDQGRPRIRGHRRQVDFSQVNRRLSRAGSLFRLRDFQADVQFKAVVPDQGTGSGVLGEVKRQDEGRSPSSHRQDDPPLLPVDCLGGPLDGVEAFDLPGVLCPHPGMLAAQPAGGLDGVEKGARDLLDGLRIEGELALRRLLQLVLPRPTRMDPPGLLVHLHAQVPDLGRFHLCRLQTKEKRGRGMQSIHANRFHMSLFFFFAPKAVICCMEQR